MLRIRPGEDSACADSSPEGFVVGMGSYAEVPEVDVLEVPLLDASFTCRDEVIPGPEAREESAAQLWPFPMRVKRT